MDNRAFVEWAKSQPQRRKTLASFRVYCKERDLKPTKAEERSAIQFVYQRLRRGDLHEYFVYEPKHTPVEHQESITYSESREVAPINAMLEADGYKLPVTQESLGQAKQDIASCTLKVQRSVTGALTNMQSEIEIERVQRANAEELVKVYRQVAEERLHDKRFLQDYVSQKGHGGNEVA